MMMKMKMVVMIMIMMTMMMMIRIIMMMVMMMMMMVMMMMIIIIIIMLTVLRDHISHWHMLHLINAPPIINQKKANSFFFYLFCLKGSPTYIMQVNFLSFFSLNNNFSYQPAGTHTLSYTLSFSITLRFLKMLGLLW